MPRAIAVLNAGSSSLKFSIYRDEAGADLAAIVRGQLDGLYGRSRFQAKNAAGRPIASHEWKEGVNLGHDGAIKHLLNWLEGGALPDLPLAAVGHRVVHGALKYFSPMRVNAEVIRKLEDLIPLAPLHQPHNLIAIHVLNQEFPGVPQVACFDTAFHRTQPEEAQRLAIPERYHQKGVRRYGFHGLSYEYITSRLPEMGLNSARVIVAHLGNGCSLCAIKDGRSAATTMGFSPLDGPPMGTRCGSIDPGVLLYLMEHEKLEAKAIEHLLYHESGLLAVSGISSDMRTLLASDDARAAEAISLFVYRVGREIGSLAAALGGVDAIIFTGGIGEHATSVRARIVEGASWLGLALDRDANDAGGPKISQPGPVSAWVVPTDEEIVIARHTRDLIDRG